MQIVTKVNKKGTKGDIEESKYDQNQQNFTKKLQEINQKAATTKNRNDPHNVNENWESHPLFGIVNMKEPNSATHPKNKETIMSTLKQQQSPGKKGPQDLKNG